jgi:hypothetical protein
MADDRRYEGVAFHGLSNYQAPTDADIQRGIDAAMRQTVRHDSGSVHNPSSVATTPAADSGRVRGTAGSDNGWVEPKPLAVPDGVALIDRLVQTLLPHGEKSGAK